MMNKLYTLFLICFFSVFALVQNADAQCAASETGLAVIELESPNLADVEPFIAGQQYTFVFFYNYLFTSKGADCIDPASISIDVNPPGAVDVVSGPNVAGAFFTITIVPNNSNFDLTVSANDEDCNGETELSCASLPIRELTVPVEFVSVDAKPNLNGGIDVDWTTATEYNNEYYEVQRSNGNDLFETIGRVEGNGDSDGFRAYSFTDENPIVGANYYRLRQVDFNGESGYSDVVIENYVGQVDYAITPNPSVTGENFRLVFNANENQNANVSMYNIAGKLLVNRNASVVKGANVLELENNFDEGIYIVNLNVDGQSITKRVLVSQYRP